MKHRFVIIIVTCLCFSCCKLFNLDDPSSISLNDIFILSASPDIIYANGYDRAKIMVSLVGDTKDGKKVTIKTDNGRFSSLPYGIDDKARSQTIEVNAINRKAEVYLISSTKVGAANVSASIEGFTQCASISFARYYPQRIKLSATSYELKANGNDTATLNVSLITKDDIGITSEGTRIILSALDLATMQDVKELYRETVSNERGEATFSICGRRTGLIKLTAYLYDYPQINDSVEIKFTQ